MKSKLFNKFIALLFTPAIFFALLACSGGGLGGPSGGLQHLDGNAVGVDTPGTTQNQAGPAERPAYTSSTDPQDGINLEELRETCKTFLDANDKEEAPQRCQDYWDVLVNGPYVAPTICTVGVNCPKGQLYTIEPPETIVTEPDVLQITIPNRGGDGTTNQFLTTYGRQLPEGVQLYRADDDDN